MGKAKDAKAKTKKAAASSSSGSKGDAAAPKPAKDKVSLQPASGRCDSAALSPGLVPPRFCTRQAHMDMAPLHCTQDSGRAAGCRLGSVPQAERAVPSPTLSHDQGKKGKSGSSSGLFYGDPLERELAAVGLRVAKITADGNCLFRAVCDQVEVSASYK